MAKILKLIKLENSFYFNIRYVNRIDKPNNITKA